MTPLQFVDSLRDVVEKSSAVDVIAKLERPPGRKPAAELMQLHAWYSSLSPEQRAGAEAVVRMAARDATFGFLAVLDGARAVDPDGETGTFRLVYEKDGREVVLVGEEGPLLHELF